MSDTNFKIIVIDDNQSIHHDFIKILKSESFNELDTLNAELFGEDIGKSEFPQFEIDVASQGQEGVARIKQALDQGIHYSLAFVDIRMPPGWDGIETIKHIWELDKEIQIVICTAYSDYSWEETVAHLGKTDNLLILKKPFDNVSVRQLACALTTKWQLAAESRKYTSRLQEQVADKTLSLQKSLSLVKSTFESSSDGILVIDNEGNIIDYNQNMISLLNIPKSIFETPSLENFLDYLNTHLENAQEFSEKIQELQQKKEDVSIQTIRFKNGKIFECYSQPHKLNNKIIGRILDFRDITKRAKLEQELEFQATHDALTGLANRVKLLEKMKLAIKTSEENHSKFAVFFMDFDRFKLINDSLSHQVGDEILKRAAVRLQSVVRAQDTLARLGGDEFVIIYLNITKQEDIETLARQLIHLFHQPFNICDRQVIITPSIGISRFPDDGKAVDILLRDADVAMYRAKSRKGNNFQFYNSEMSSLSLAELEQETELRQALERGEFYLCYQPQLDLSNDKLIAVEALIRWNHPKKGVLLPMDFVPFAENIGLMPSIGEWVMRTACQQNKAWQDAGFPPIRMAVNVSQQQFDQHNLVTLVAQILQETNLKPEYLEIELTENVVVSNSEILRTLTELKEIGVMVTIDDFGTGYSSLSYLNRLPLDRLKIDGSFVQHIQSAADDEVIIRAVISMAKNLKLEVLAEGVENIDQLNFLRKNQCGDIQGFYFSKPLSSNEIEKYLADPKKVKNIMEH